jgi:hypothetical protein
LKSGSKSAFLLGSASPTGNSHFSKFRRLR